MTTPPTNSTMDDVGQFDAIRLFVERARAIVPRFTLTPENIGLVASVCRQLDGIPLAIELASARINVLTVEQIEARLRDRYKLLGEAIHITSSHHHTLRAALDWSYDLLTSAEQAVCSGIGLWGLLATAEAVCSGDGLSTNRCSSFGVANLKSLVVAQTLQRGGRAILPERSGNAREADSSGEWLAMRPALHCFLQMTEETAEKLTEQ
jgi:hypothetical protein